MPRRFTNQRVLVMGLGQFGGGVGVARFLARQGAHVTVTDQKQPDQLAQSIAALSDLPIHMKLGEHDIADFQNADLIVANPAVCVHKNQYLAAAQQADIPLTTEISLLVEQLPNQTLVIAVTGTAGKSTTTAMVGHILKKADFKPNVYIGGNIGGSLLDHVQQITPADIVVLELSSFMLHFLDLQQWSPNIAVVTNFAPNHLDWHPSVEDYQRAKQAILNHQAPGDTAVLGPAVADSPIAPHVHRTVVPANPPQLALPLAGAHNQLNAHLALNAVAAARRAEPNQFAPLLADFQPLPHRLCHILTRNGVAFVDDSKSTTPESAILAIESFDPNTVHLIVGGYDKQADLDPLAACIARRNTIAYTIGATGPKLRNAVTAAGGTALACRQLPHAVQRAAAAAQPGHVVLLSPGCASWDQFENFQQRGEHFAKYVHQHA